MKFKKLRTWCNTKMRRNILLVLGISNLLALLLLVMDLVTAMKPNDQLLRNEQGKGNKTEALVVTIGDELKREQFPIEVEERIYTKKEIKKVFKQCISRLDQIVLGKNKSPDEVRSDLNFPTKIPDEPIQVSWQLDNYEAVNANGELQEDKLKQEGTLVRIEGTLSYREEKAQYMMAVRLLPPKLNQTEQWIADVRRALEDSNKNTQSASAYMLPKQVRGETVVWKRPLQKRAFAVSFLGLLAAGLLVALKEQNKKKAEDDKRKQMAIDYPEIINQFTLLVGAGMTVQSAWKKIVDEYQDARAAGKLRYAYEEMQYTCREIQSGLSEGECYERFGYRCQIQAYIKFGVLLSQNLRKGTKGLTGLLSVEAAQAFENRKRLAKKLGEEAGTRLLIPMFGMLAIVLVIVVVPAFLSIQL